MVSKQKIRQKPKTEALSALRSAGSSILEIKKQNSFEQSYFSKAIEQAVILIKDLEFRSDTSELRQSHLLNLDSDQGR